jgi:hypothetical protein
MMSDKKAEANRRNSLKSTGPRTPEGKTSVRLNALKHGLLSEEVLLPGEDEGALRKIAESLRAQLQPVGELETLLVGRIISLLWRLRRLVRVEASIFAWELYGELAERAERQARAQESTMASMLIASHTSVTDKRKHGEALERAEEMRVKQDAETATLGLTFVRDADKTNAFSKLSRYETTIERGLYRALHELQRLQAARVAAGSVSPPLAEL